MSDPRWATFIGASPLASVAHAPEWLKALNKTYGFEPIVFTTSPPDASVANGIVLCRIASWLTGRRLVSLPFTDHCDALAGNPGDIDEILDALRRTAADENLKYVELRPRARVRPRLPDWETGSAFRFHELDLSPSLDALLGSAHKTAIQQPIRRAERESLTYAEGRSETLLREFYRLVVLTRRRQGLPPQPILWFRTLIATMGDRVKIRTASKDGQTVAGILTLDAGRTVLYKYGCSDARFHSLGGMPFLIWKTIQEAKQAGARTLDFGRSDPGNSGLIAFKDRWGASQSSLTYLRYSARPRRRAGEAYGTRLAQQSFARMPAAVVTAAGRMLYRHIG